MSKPKLNTVKPTSTKSVKRTASRQPISAASHSKLEAIIILLKRPKGATLEQMMEATGWQRHSVHGTMSGVLKKRHGLPIISELGDKGRFYRIAGNAR